MSRRIYKYPLDIYNEGTYVDGRIKEVRIFGFVNVLSVIEQNGDIVLYAIIDDTEAQEEIFEGEPVVIRVAIIGTGHDGRGILNSRDWYFLDTVKLNDNLIFHIFIEEIEETEEV